MSTHKWLCDHLTSSGEGFVWSAEQVPMEHRFATPPNGLGEWSAARHIFHMLFYELNFAIPAVRYWMGEPRPSFEILDEETDWRNRREFAGILEQFLQARADQVRLLSGLDETLWGQTLATDWGDVALQWVVSKTYQHTAEHINDVLRIALFWERFEERQRATRSET